MMDRISISDRCIAWALADIFDAPERREIPREYVVSAPSVAERCVARRRLRGGKNFDSSGLLSRLTEGL